MRDREQGSWCEGKIIRIVYDPNIAQIPKIDTTSAGVLPISDNSDESFDTAINDVENKPPSDLTNGDNLSKTKNKGIARYFTKSPKAVRKKQSEKDISKSEEHKDVDSLLLYKIQLEAE